MTPVPRILAIGDSHSCFWGGENVVKGTFFQSSAFAGVDILPLGGVTAHGISAFFPQHRGLGELANYLSTTKAAYGGIIFSFGEIDCRCHLVRLAMKNGGDIRALAQTTAHRYFTFVERIVKALDMFGVIWGPIPSTPPDRFCFNPLYPAVGSILERNFATHVFTSTLSELASRSSRVSHIDVFDDLTDDASVTKAEYLYDGCHLSNAYLGRAADKLCAALLGLGADHLLPSAFRNWPMVSGYRLRNVAAGQPYTLSSAWLGRSWHPLAESPCGRVSFHTEFEEAPHIIVFLDGAYFIEEIVVHNRVDYCQERARSLAVALSIDGVDYEQVYTPMGDEWSVFGAGDEALRVKVQMDMPFRFVKLYLQEKNFLHLDCVQVFARSFILNNECDEMRIAKEREPRRIEGRRWEEVTVARSPPKTCWNDEGKDDAMPMARSLQRPDADVVQTDALAALGIPMIQDATACLNGGGPSAVARLSGR